MNKKITSLILAGALTASVGMMPKEVHAQTTVNSYGYEITDQNLNVLGLYNTFINGTRVYVYLNNKVENHYLPLRDAISVAENYYDSVYLYRRTLNGQTIYALSPNSSESSWTKITNKYNVSNDTYVATSIKLGEFLLNQNMQNYIYNMNGYAYADINRDGANNELLYIGNNKYNDLLSKEAAYDWASRTYNTYYIQHKTVNDPANNFVTLDLYAISDKAYVSGWTRVSKDLVKNDTKISTNTEYYDALMDIYTNLNYHNQNNYNNNGTVIINPYYSNPNNTNINPNNYDYNNYNNNYNFYTRLIKSSALDYGYKNYNNFCILSKTVNNETIYTLSQTVYVDGWDIIPNKDIPTNAYLFLNLWEAQNYENYLINNYNRVLK